MSVAEQFQKLEAHASGLIIGQAHLINRMLIALLCDGHLLVEGAPGLAKTRGDRCATEGRINSDSSVTTAKGSSPPRTWSSDRAPRLIGSCEGG